MTFADSQVVYRDLDGVWGSFRLFIGGKAVTQFRGVPAEIGGYQLTEPYSFGPADFRFPQITMFEADQFGTGSLSWLDNGKTAVLRQVDGSGAVVRTVWRGIVTQLSVTLEGTTVHCDGEASGRLAMRAKLPGLFASQHPVGARLFNAFRDCRLTLSPHLGGGIGVTTDGRGMVGTMLDYADSLLAATIDTDGSQYTIGWRETQNDYHLSLKDTTTIDFTAFLGAHGVDPDISSDLSEMPTTIYGSGVAPNGLVWVNAKAPGLQQGEVPPYPMADNSAFGLGTTNADTDTGDGISVMLSKLAGMGYLDRADEAGGYDADVVEAVKDLQDDRGVTQSGTMNVTTWRALFDADVTGESLANAFTAPLAQLSTVRPWNLTANGSKASRNPLYDPKVVEVDLAVDHGPSVEKSRARRWSRGVLKRSQNQKNWAGTLTLTADVHPGDKSFATVGDHVMSRLDIKPGMNMRLRHFDGNTKFHVSVVNVASDLSVTLGVDTQARDAATLGEVIARNIASRVNPGRQWLEQRRANVHARHVEFSELGGQLFNKVTCPGGDWTVVAVPVGQAGSVSRMRIQTSNRPAAFVVAVTALHTGPAFWRSKVGNPLSGSPLDDVALNRGGSGYTSAPDVHFEGGGGTGASATASIAGGKVVSLTLTNAGSGYQAPPNVTFTGGGGTGAKGTAYVTTDNKWTSQRLQNLIDRDRALLGAWGIPDQPCGYQPGAYTNQNGNLTGDPVTGLFLDDGGFDYHTFADPVLYVAIYPDRDTVIKPQRIFWDVQESLA